MYANSSVVSRYPPVETLLRQLKQQGVIEPEGNGQREKVVIIPGNGGGSVHGSNWYDWVQDKLVQDGFRVILHDMPDPELAREAVWLQFLRDNCKVDSETIVIGHSSGACALLRLLETTKVKGAVVVSGYSSDLGDEYEAASGYFNRPWKWEEISRNADWIVQFGSSDDPLLGKKGVREMREIAKCIRSEYSEFKNRGHFQQDTFVELVSAVKKHCKCS